MSVTDLCRLRDKFSTARRAGWFGRAAALVAITALALALAVSPVLGASSRVIRADAWIGTFAVKGNGKLAGAERAFGKPASLRRTAAGCRAQWPALGLRIDFYNLGGGDPCRPAQGYFQSAVMSGPGWRTSNGLASGDSLIRLRRLFPRAERHGAEQWLVVRETQATGRYPGLSTKIVTGKVASFEVIYGAGGE